MRSAISASRTAASASPAELRFFVPWPTMILLGCGPLVPDHARRRGEPCPVCKGSVRDVADRAGIEKPTAVYCGQCDALDPRHEPNVARQRAEARVVAEGTDRARREAEDADRLAEQKGRARLTEGERRRIWYGNARTVVAGDGPSNLAKAGREFLQRIGQLPDWSLILDARGKVVGRYGADEAEQT